MLNKNNLSGYLSIIIRLFNIGLIFYITLTIPTYLSVNQYSYYAKYFASISLISILIMGGLPNFILRIKNRMNMNGMSNHSIRINLYPIQIIFAFILSILFFGSEINFRNESYNFLVLLGTATLITFIKFEKNLLVADGRGLISQISEMIIYPIFFLLFIFFIIETNNYFDFLELRFFALLIAAFCSIIIAIFINKNKNEIQKLKISDFKDNYLIIFLPIFGINVFLDSFTLITDIYIGGEYIANFDLARKFGFLPYLIMISFLVPYSKKIREEGFSSYNKKHLINLQSTTTYLIVLTSIFSLIVAYFYQQIFASEYKNITFFTLIIISSWILISKYAFYIQAATYVSLPKIILALYVKSFIFCIFLILIIIYFGLINLIIFVIPFYIFFLGKNSEKIFYSIKRNN